MWTRFLIVLCFMALAPLLEAAVLSRAQPAGSADGMQVAGVLPKNSAEQFELTFWNSIKDSKQVSDYEAYLHAYPKGRFASLARARIDQLRAAGAQAKTGGQGQTAQTQSAGPAPAVPPPAVTPARPAPKQPAGKPRTQVAQAEAPAGPEPATPTPTGPVAAIKDCPACPVLLALNPVPFTMGSNSSDPSERPAHKVAIKSPFAVGKYEVTVDQWNACVQANVCPSIPSAATAGGSQPMRDVSWDEAQLFLKWLSSLSGRLYRLPTEAEWEYAARGGTATKHWWGDKMKDGNTSCKGCGQPWDADSPPPVGSFAANPFGFFDMNGSVWEWVADCWHSSFKGAPGDGSAWNGASCQARVIRGGSWREDASYMLSTTRFKYDAGVRQSQNGFRVARTLK